MSSQPASQPPESPAILPSFPTSNVSRRATLRGIGGLSAALLLAATPRFAGAHSAPTDAQSASFDPPASVVGAWDLSFRRHEEVAASSLDRVLATFGAEGGFQASLAPAWITPAGSTRFHGGGHGSWTTVDEGIVEARYTVLIYDEFGACDGARQVSIRASLESRTFLSGAYVSYLHDANGTLVDLVSGSVDGIVAGIPSTGSRDYPSVTLSDSNDMPPLPGLPGESF